MIPSCMHGACSSTTLPFGVRRLLLADGHLLLPAPASLVLFPLLPHSATHPSHCYNRRKRGSRIESNRECLLGFSAKSTKDKQVNCPPLDLSQLWGCFKTCIPSAHPLNKPDGFESKIKPKTSGTVLTVLTFVRVPRFTYVFSSRGDHLNKLCTSRKK